MTDTVDAIIVGAGMAGVTLAAALAPYKRVRIVEAERVPAYHATGRSAAFWTESYGGPGVQPLTSASGPWLANPPKDYGGAPFLRPRGALTLARRDEIALLDAMEAEFAGAITFERVDRAALHVRVPMLNDDWDAALAEPRCMDIDVAALHAAALKRARHHGAILSCDAALRSATWDGALWRVESEAGVWHAPLLINAAGAWADDVARSAGVSPIGIQPYRRTMVQVRVEPAVPADLPLLLAADGRFYVKAEGGGRLWLTPHDETPSDPCDAAPEEIDVALAIDRLHRATGWRVIAVERKWAGLRSFASDRLPVIGPDPAHPALFWFAGQGGFGIQTAPAAAALAAAQILGQALPDWLRGVDAALYRPDRLRR